MRERAKLETVLNEITAKAAGAVAGPVASARAAGGGGEAEGERGGGLMDLAEGLRARVEEVERELESARKALVTAR